MNEKIKNMVNSALFGAMIFVLTRFVQIPIGAGYVHFGDALIYIVASLLNAPWAIASAVVGSVLADLTSGFAVYAPATFIIKALIALPFILVNSRGVKILTPASIALTVLSGVVTVGGYFIADMIIDRSYAYVDILGNVIQAVGSAVIFVILAGAFDTAGIKKKLFLKGEGK